MFGVSAEGERVRRRFVRQADGFRPCDMCMAFCLESIAKPLVVHKYDQIIATLVIIRIFGSMTYG